MDVEDMQKTAKLNSAKHIYLFNPLLQDFTCTYDVNKNGKPVEYTIPSKENLKLPYDVAQGIGLHLVNAYIEDRDIKQSREAAIKKARKLIFSDE